MECPSNFSHWLDLGGQYCYYIEDKTRAQWGEASRKCIMKNSTLVSFHSEHELRVFQPYISSLQINPWIGLVQKADGGFQWTDYSPVDYTNWGDKEPNNAATDHCVQLETENMVWKTTRCTYYSEYICMMKKVPGQPDEKENPVEKSGKRLAPWAVAVICLSMLTLAGVMIGLWFFKRKEKSTLKSPPLSFDNIMYVSGTETLSSPSSSA
ncbi:macrophage mannose receptor 1-like [Limulus polyphemus]|uniref:Macrophage mannose receptor 1-like n=1 Tax=Limulus polyphemus TaxID=6850 RepID=A0ABM1TGA8_LIMPO|nr:macrophage mannose receptor 1-like [Limulus polyphemus]